ncbi:MAG TPA: hypothetical protein H9896_05130, partial [Candidatus Pygmaiobacter gallistercoris]|nr:hypothetical protein [Candidatus Pygmaiobacter gallistercoris]
LYTFSIKQSLIFPPLPQRFCSFGGYSGTALSWPAADLRRPSFAAPALHGIGLNIPNKFY